MAIIDAIDKNGKYTLGNFEEPKLDNIFTLPATKRVPMLGLELEEFYELGGVEVANLEGTAYLMAWGFTKFKLVYTFDPGSDKLILNIVEVKFDDK